MDPDFFDLLAGSLHAPGPDPERALTEKQSRYGIRQKSVSDLAGISVSVVWFPRQNLHLTPDS
jgi:hypothetical protein